jgi:hypothetical protein
MAALQTRNKFFNCPVLTGALLPFSYLVVIYLTKWINLWYLSFRCSELRKLLEAHSRGWVRFRYTTNYSRSIINICFYDNFSTRLSIWRAYASLLIRLRLCLSKPSLFYCLFTIENNFSFNLVLMFMFCKAIFSIKLYLFEVTYCIIQGPIFFETLSLFHL